MARETADGAGPTPLTHPLLFYHPLLFLDYGAHGAILKWINEKNHVDDKVEV